MTMRKWAGSVLFTAAAAAAVVGMTVGPALASTTLTVKVSGGGSYSASTNKTTLSDNGVSVTCSGSKAAGTISNGTHKGKAPVKVGTATKLSFTGCSGPLGTVHTHVTKLSYAVKVNSKTNSKGNTDVIITGVNVSVSMTGCSFNVTGSAPGYVNNAKHSLNMTPKPPIKETAKLTVSGVNGCAGLVNNGDHPTYTSTYKVSPKITIKSS